MKDCWWCVLLVVILVVFIAISVGYLIGTFLVLSDLLISWG